jgi:hypothetical protein
MLLCLKEYRSLNLHFEQGVIVQLDSNFEDWLLRDSPGSFSVIDPKTANEAQVAYRNSIQNALQTEPAAVPASAAEVKAEAEVDRELGEAALADAALAPDAPFTPAATPYQESVYEQSVPEVAPVAPAAPEASPAVPAGYETMASADANKMSVKNSGVATIPNPKPV